MPWPNEYDTIPNGAGGIPLSDGHLDAHGKLASSVRRLQEAFGTGTTNSAAGVVGNILARLATVEAGLERLNSAPGANQLTNAWAFMTDSLTGTTWTPSGAGSPGGTSTVALLPGEQRPSGARIFRLTTTTAPGGSGGMVFLQSSATGSWPPAPRTVTAGARYYGTIAIRPSTDRVCMMQLRYYDGSTFVGDWVSSDLSVAANQWGVLSVLLPSAPAGAAVRVRCQAGIRGGNLNETFDLTEAAFYQATDWAPPGIVAAPRPPQMKTVTIVTSQTLAVPFWATRAHIDLIGGGGGGAAGQVGHATAQNGGAGGGAGIRTIRDIAVTGGTNMSCTVAAAAAGGVFGGAAAGSGGQSLLTYDGIQYLARGGGGGQAAIAGESGLVAPIKAGFPGTPLNDTNYRWLLHYGVLGGGADSAYGCNGPIGGQFGGGGGGRATASLGGAGGAAYMNPSDSYPRAGANGGSASSSGQNGLSPSTDYRGHGGGGGGGAAPGGTPGNGGAGSGGQITVSFRSE